MVWGKLSHSKRKEVQQQKGIEEKHVWKTGGQTLNPVASCPAGGSNYGEI